VAEGLSATEVGTNPSAPKGPRYCPSTPDRSVYCCSSRPSRSSQLPGPPA